MGNLTLSLGTTSPYPWLDQYIDAVFGNWPLSKDSISTFSGDSGVKYKKTKKKCKFQLILSATSATKNESNFFFQQELPKGRDILNEKLLCPLRTMGTKRIILATLTPPSQSARGEALVELLSL